MVAFAEEVEEIINMLREATQVIRRMIDSLRKGETPDFNTLDEFFITYYNLVSMTAKFHKTWVISPYLFVGKPTYETIEEIAIKFIELTKEYEKVVTKYPRTDDMEKIELLKTLASTINKYISEIETLLIKLEEEIGTRREPEWLHEL
jgi:3-dehydroquinate dehydratase